MTNILELKERLAAARVAEYETKETLGILETKLEIEISDKRAAFQQSNFELINDRDEAAKQRTAIEDELRAALVEHYKETGNKTFDKQLSVRVNTAFKYDEQEAETWARTNAPFTLSLDKKKFEKVAPMLAFVETVETPSAVIAKVLTEEINELLKTFPARENQGRAA